MRMAASSHVTMGSRITVPVPKVTTRRAHPPRVWVRSRTRHKTRMQGAHNRGWRPHLRGKRCGDGRFVMLANASRPQVAVPQ